jgi:hypothetical protein
MSDKPAGYWSKLWNRIVRKRIDQVQNQTDQGQPNPEQTTAVGTPATGAPSIPETARMFLERYARRQVIDDVRKMLADNPMLAEAADVFVDTAVSKSFTVTVETTATRGVNAGNQRKAQRIIDEINRKAEIRRRIPSWCKKGLTEGDLFVQTAEYGGEVVDAFSMPGASMERLSDLRDKFEDPTRAYAQIDLLSNQEITPFAEWQIQHARWNHEDGCRYGNSQYLQIRGLSNVFLQMIEDMAVRRHTRGPMRYFHKVGSPEKPGTPDDVKAYIELNKFGPDTPTPHNFFGNGLTDVTAIQGDEHLDQIEDVQFVLNVLFPRTSIAKGLIGFGETISRDILDEQRELFYTKQDLLIDWAEFGTLRPTYDLGLLLGDVNPDSVVYTVQFEERMSERAKMARIELYLEMHLARLMTRKQLIQRIAPYLNVKDVDVYVKELLDEKWEQISSQAAATGGDPNTQMAQDALVKGTVGRRGNVIGRIGRQ